MCLGGYLQVPSGGTRDTGLRGIVDPDKALSLPGGLTHLRAPPSCHQFCKRCCRSGFPTLLLFRLQLFRKPKGGLNNEYDQVISVIRLVCQSMYLWAFNVSGFDARFHISRNCERSRLTHSYSPQMSGGAVETCLLKALKLELQKYAPCFFVKYLLHRLSLQNFKGTPSLPVPNDDKTSILI
ncbi:hypothetical protein T440DRAFT_185192 [Plenodomus tracheiphilus IPT5]|uniref:Uncharacterized protein n=1 Tax=Plenodomus tracheiphilus IPT5 TaxID=1408161 RepID=A0A6A7AZW8_9PLEO|nr:hypothetical protein T440DRAFT_185192 [Plenodomus tracheiphilus IPT5]